MYTKKRSLKKFFEKWRNEKWLFSTIGYIALFTLLCLLKGLFSYQWFNPFEVTLLSLVDLALSIMAGVAVGFIFVLISVPFVNLGAVIISFIKNSPGKYSYPITLSEIYEDDSIGEKIVIDVFVIVFFVFLIFFPIGHEL